jgi:AhpD family alkylhydroperoxidase
MSRIPPANTGDVGLTGTIDLIIRERGALGELYPMLLHNPAIAEGMISLGNGVRKQSSLSPKLRELVICRVGILNEAHYEVLRHREIARSLGESEGRLEELTAWESSERFDAAERSALRLADEMTRSVMVSDNVFDDLRRHFSDQQILELTVTAAYYNMVSRILVALQIGDSQ